MRSCVKSTASRLWARLANSSTAWAIRTPHADLMKASGVPIIPGSGILENVDEAKKAAKEIGYPVMLKASAGGGGKGIRLVKTEDELEQAFKTASSEAQQAFGDGRMYMENTFTRQNT